jgi:hypothetical protein
MSVAAEAKFPSPASPVIQVKGKEAVMEALEDITFGSVGSPCIPRQLPLIIIRSLVLAASISSIHLIRSKFVYNHNPTTNHYGTEVLSIASSKVSKAMGWLDYIGVSAPL